MFGGFDECVPTDCVAMLCLFNHACGTFPSGSGLEKSDHVHPQTRKAACCLMPHQITARYVATASKIYRSAQSNTGLSWRPSSIIPPGQLPFRFERCGMMSSAF